MGKPRRMASSNQFSATDLRLYFIQAASRTGCIKIGVAGMVEERLFALAASSPLPLVLLGHASHMGHTDESRLHWRFRAAHSHGEWFHPIAELLLLIDEVRATGAIARHWVAERPEPGWKRASMRASLERAAAAEFHTAGLS